MIGDIVNGRYKASRAGFSRSSLGTPPRAATGEGVRPDPTTPKPPPTIGEGGGQTRPSLGHRQLSRTGKRGRRVGGPRHVREEKVAAHQQLGAGEEKAAREATGDRGGGGRALARQMDGVGWSVGLGFSAYLYGLCLFGGLGCVHCSGG